jgi:hypothetical protein
LKNGEVSYLWYVYNPIPKAMTMWSKRHDYVQQFHTTGTLPSRYSAALDGSHSESLPDLPAKLVLLDERWSYEILITDLLDGNELRISFWRTVRVPEDGKVYDLPAGLGRFPLFSALPIQDLLVKEEVEEIDLLLPMDWYQGARSVVKMWMRGFDYII